MKCNPNASSNPCEWVPFGFIGNFRQGDPYLKVLGRMIMKCFGYSLHHVCFSTRQYSGICFGYEHL